MREYEDLNSKRRGRIPRALWLFWAPDPEKYYRWRVQLECGCITEVLTYGDKDLPSEVQWPDHISKARLPAGQIICGHEDFSAALYQNITEWGERREVLFPADPVEPPDYLSDPDVWVVLRRDEPRTSASWSVTLSCGHVTDVVTDLDWKPEDGPHRTSATRQQEMIAAFDELWASDPDAQDERQREHIKRMLAQGWPRPQPEQLCYTCSRARYIVAYQRAGWLVPRTPEPKPSKPPSRSILEQRLRQAETDAARLRERIADLDSP